MRVPGIVTWCVGLALLLGGCDPTRDSRYLHEGIGSDLYWDGLPAATQLQDIYLSNICAQAISNTARMDAVSCDGLSLTRREWGLLVQAGMNDIDLRCDAYLSWLYDRKSSKEPFLKELAALGGAAAGILATTHAGATPIALTAIAFGIAADTFTNIDLRLVNAVDYTTAGSVVRDNRTKFRISNLDVIVDNRPAAIYILRNYLSICVPDSIEMSINNTLAVYHRAGPEALLVPSIGLRTANGTATSSTSAAVRGAPIVIRADQPPPPAPAPPSVMSGAKGSIEGAVSLDSGMAMQRALCVPETGAFDAATRTELKNFNVASLYPTDSGATNGLATPADLKRLRNALKVFPSCKDAGFVSGFEEGLFATFGEKRMRADLKAALVSAGLTAPSGLDATGSVAADSSVRDAIANLRTKYKLPGKPVFDRDFYDTMTKTLVR